MLYQLNTNDIFVANLFKNCSFLFLSGRYILFSQLELMNHKTATYEKYGNFIINKS